MKLVKIVVLGLLVVVVSGCTSESGVQVGSSDNGMQTLNAYMSGVYKDRDGNSISFAEELLISYKNDPFSPDVVAMSITGEGKLKVAANVCLGLDILREGATNWRLEVGTSDHSPNLFNHNCDQTYQSEIGRDVTLTGQDTISFPVETTIRSFGGSHLIGDVHSEDYYFDNGTLSPRL